MPIYGRLNQAYRSKGVYMVGFWVLISKLVSIVSLMIGV